MAVFLLVPAGDDADRLRELLARALDLGRPDLRVVVLDDGSDGGAAAVVRAFPTVTLLRQGRRHGLGLAYRTLLRYALALGAPGDLVVTMATSEAEDAGQIPSLIAAAERGADLVIASRCGVGAAGGNPRRLDRTLCRWLFPALGTCELAGSFRLYRAELLVGMTQVKPALVAGGDGTADAELLLTACTLNPRIAEVPLPLRPQPRGGESGRGALRTSLSYLGLLYDARVTTLRRARRLQGRPPADSPYPAPLTPTVARAGTGPRAHSG